MTNSLLCLRSYYANSYSAYKYVALVYRDIIILRVQYYQYIFYHIRSSNDCCINVFKLYCVLCCIIYNAHLAVHFSATTLIPVKSCTGHSKYDF